MLTLSFIERNSFLCWCVNSIAARDPASSGGLLCHQALPFSLRWLGFAYVALNGLGSFALSSSPVLPADVGLSRGRLERQKEL